MRYEVTLSIENAPGPFDSVTGYLQYDVTNAACVPETGPSWNRMRIPPEKNPEIVFTKMTNNIYKATVFGDYFQDEDYFGLGVCRWSLMLTTARLKVNKAMLDASLPAEDLFSQKSATISFVRQDYLDNDTERFPSGFTDLSNFPTIKRENTFSVTLSAKESFQ